MGLTKYQLKIKNYISNNRRNKVFSTDVWSLYNYISIANFLIFICIKTNGYNALKIYRKKKQIYKKPKSTIKSVTMKDT